MQSMTSVHASASFLMTLLWLLATERQQTTAVSTSTTTVTNPTTVSQKETDENDDEGVCFTRFIESVDPTRRNAASNHREVVSIAAILELRQQHPMGCGNVSDGELQTVAALLWAVHKLNGLAAPNSSAFIPGVTLELRVYDDCSQTLLAARHVGEILGSHPDFNCTPPTSALAGFLGTSTSHTTSQVARLLAETSIPLFGVSATVSLLSNKTTYPNFFRTVPSDLTQSKVLVDIVRHLQWTYVAGIYTSDNYGIEGFMEFKRLASLEGVCIIHELMFWHGDDNVVTQLTDFIRRLLSELVTTRENRLGVVFFGHDKDAHKLFDVIDSHRTQWHNREQLHNLHWLFSDGAGTDDTFAAKAFHHEYTSRFISISPAVTPLEDVYDAFLDAVNRPEQLGSYWQALVREYLVEVQGCHDTTSPVSNCHLRDKIVSYDYVPAALDSVYSLAALLKEAHKDACGAGFSGVCQNLTDVLKKGMLSSSFQPGDLNYSSVFSASQLPQAFQGGRFLLKDEFGDFVPANEPLYSVNIASDGQWRKIGNYKNGSLNINLNAHSQLSNLKSECGTDCADCRHSDRIHYTYRPGDVILMGLFSFSAAGPGFSCGDYRGQSSTVAALLAFLRTVEMMSGTGADGVKFGALVLDDCYNKLTASALLTNLFSGKISLADPETNQVVDISKAVAAVGSQSSGVTLSALNLLTPLEVPTVSYLATSPDLDDRAAFPYFLRTVPSDSLQARALVEIVRHLNVTYVAGIYQDNIYGLRGMEQFVQKAQEIGVCVEMPVAVDDGTSEERLSQILTSFKSKDVVVIVVFILEEMAARLLDSLRDESFRFVFLASEAWGTSVVTMSGQRSMVARGSVVLTVDSTHEAGDIDMASYLQGLPTPLPSASTALPWMADFWEKEMQCNLPGSFTNAQSRMCDASATLGSSVAKQLAGDQKVVQTVNAVASIITALKRTCNQQSDPAKCMRELSAETLTTQVKQVELRDKNGVNFRPYLDNGNGNVGFTLHNVRKKSDGTYYFDKVGRYHPTQGLSLSSDLVFYDQLGHPISSLTSTCQFKSGCHQVCSVQPDPGSTPAPATPTPLAAAQEGEEGGWVAAVVVLTLLLLLLGLLLTVALCCARRRGRIPWLGAVKKEREGTRRSSYTRNPHGVTNVGYIRNSSRGSQPPLPPLPGAGSETYNYHYNRPDDLSSSLSRVSHTSSSIHDGDPAEHHRPSRQLRPQHLSLQRELSGQRPRDMGVSTSPGFVMEDVRERPRSSSMPSADMSRLGALSGIRPKGSSVSSFGEASLGRPRANSHDAGSRQRLGALSEEDLAVLMRYLHTDQTAQAHSQLTVADVERAPAVNSQSSSLPDSHVLTSSGDNQIAFQNPPSFCSSRSSLWPSCSGSESLNPAFLYLTPVANEADLYLQVLPDSPDQPAPTQAASVAEVYHAANPGVPSNFVMVPAHFPTVTQQGHSPEAMSRQVSSPDAVFYRSDVTPTTNQQHPMMTSLTSSTLSPHGSSVTSDSSGAVFISPEREYPQALGQPAGRENEFIANRGARHNIPPQTLALFADQGRGVRPPTSRTPLSSVSPEQTRVLTPARLQKLINQRQSPIMPRYPGSPIGSSPGYPQAQIPGPYQRKPSPSNNTCPLNVPLTTNTSGALRTPLPVLNNLPMTSSSLFQMNVPVLSMEQTPNFETGRVSGSAVPASMLPHEALPLHPSPSPVSGSGSQLTSPASVTPFPGVVVRDPNTGSLYLVSHAAPLQISAQPLLHSASAQRLPAAAPTAQQMPNSAKTGEPSSLIVSDGGEPQQLNEQTSASSKPKSTRKPTTPKMGVDSLQRKNMGLSKPKSRTSPASPEHAKQDWGNNLAQSQDGSSDLNNMLMTQSNSSAMTETQRESPESPSDNIILAQPFFASRENSSIPHSDKADVSSSVSSVSQTQSPNSPSNASHFAGNPNDNVSSSETQEGISASAAEVGTTSSSPAGRAESLPYIETHELFPVPPPCGPKASNQTSGSSHSDHTTDSGNGEDLTPEEVPVMC